MEPEMEGFILFGDLNTVVFWYCNDSLKFFLKEKCIIRGIDENDLTSSMTHLFGHLINVEAQYDTKQNNVDLICCENGITVKLRHLGVYSLLVIGNTEEESHLLYMADLFRAITQLFVGYSYGSISSKMDMTIFISEMLQRNSLLANSTPYQFIRACEIVPKPSIGDVSQCVGVCLENLLSSTTAASILDDFGTVLEAHCFVSNMLIGSVYGAPQTTRQSILPSELWKLRDTAFIVGRPNVTSETCTTINVFLNSCETPYFLACRAHIVSPAPNVTVVLLSEHDWSSIARPIRRLLKLLSMILRGQPSVLRLTPRHLDTIASTELNRMSDCLDEYWRNEQARSGAKGGDVAMSLSGSVGVESGESSSPALIFPSGAKMLPALGTIRSLMNRALNQFRTLRAKNAFHSFCKDPRNTAHHSTVKQLYNIVENLHTMLFQPMVLIPTPKTFSKPLLATAQELASTFCSAMSLGASLSLPRLHGGNLILCILVDRSSHTFACYPSLRSDTSSKISLRDGSISFVLQDLLNFMQVSMWRCWSLIRSGHSAATWSTDFVDCDPATGSHRSNPVKFSYSSNVVNVPASVIPESLSSNKNALPSLIPIGDASQFEQVFNDPDVTSQLIWNEHFYRLLSRIYSESAAPMECPDGRNTNGNNVFSLDFNAAMRSRQSVQEASPMSQVKTTVVYEAFCLFLEPTSSTEIDKTFRSLFSEGIELFWQSENFLFKHDKSGANRR